MDNPQYGRVRTVKKVAEGTDEVTTNTYREGKLDWHKVEIQETIRVFSHDDMVAPTLELLGKMKNQKSPEVTLNIRQTPQGFTMAASHMVVKEKK